MNPIEDFLQRIGDRLDAGRAEYGDQSFVRPVSSTVNEIDQELLDQVGWLYVLWCQAARKTDLVKRQDVLRDLWTENMRHRLLRNDRRMPSDRFGGNARHLMQEIEVLALDCFEWRTQVLRRLQPIARAIETVEAVRPFQPLGRRSSRRDPRSED